MGCKSLLFCDGDVAWSGATGREQLAELSRNRRCETGSSGSGAKPAANTHHPQRSNSFYAYKPFTHQHVPEIEQELKRIGEWNNELVFMTHSLPVSRGIFASIYTETKTEISPADARAIFADFYRDSFFVRLVESSPDINWVKTTNFCDIGLDVRGR